jgi:RNA polymerase-binding transcription factor DksA
VNDQDCQRYRAQLEKIALRVRSDANSVADTALGPSGGQAAGELSNAPFHLGDRGTEEYLTEVNTALIENEQYLVTESRAALERLDAGKFGLCENCGKPIAKERLNAMPYARYCVDCAAKLNEGQPVSLP